MKTHTHVSPDGKEIRKKTTSWTGTSIPGRLRQRVDDVSPTDVTVSEQSFVAFDHSRYYGLSD